ncbi:Tpd52l2 [Phodopus roborovskii]|uniref:Tpd52l2 protein n=1 Tax=Phodopus roborovskii TaxID=109678 RepID=A0AAU9ZDC6_PHORO|nr:Tpd52l2 [Phodopus roborovskii]
MDKEIGLVTRNCTALPGKGQQRSYLWMGVGGMEMRI